MDDGCIFAIDITSDTLTAAFVYADGREEGSSGFDLADFMTGETGHLEKMVSLLAAKARTAAAPIRTVAVAIPCDLSPDRRTVVNFPHALWLNNQPLAEILEGALSAPVVMERRAVTMLCCDHALLGLPADALVVGCYVDTHYDNAIWYCGKPLLGKNGMAGNIGHMTIQEREDNCFCGKLGCVDLYGAGLRLNQLHNMIFPDTPREDLFVKHGDHPIVQDYLSMMAYPIAIEANILDPDFLILGGSIPAMRGFPRATLEDAIRRHCYYPAPSTGLVFLPSEASHLPGTSALAMYVGTRL